MLLNGETGPHAAASGRDRAIAETQPTQASAATVQWLQPNRGLRFIDFEIPLTGLTDVVYRFVEESHATAHIADAADSAALVPLPERGSDLPMHPISGAPLQAGDVITVRVHDCLTRLSGCWLPLPFLRTLAQRDASRADVGPENWARLFIAPPDDNDLWTAPFVRATLVFDTAIDPRPRNEQVPYAGPNLEDVRRGATFALGAGLADAGAFLSQPWVGFALRAALRDPRSDGASQRLASRDAAHYLALLSWLDRQAALPAVRFATPERARRRASEAIQLVIDMDDAEIAAMLVDARGQGQPLSLRDLSAPQRRATGPWPAHVEFARAPFGDPASDRLSGRPDAFAWPSLVRVGPEGVRLAAHASAVEGVTGTTRLLSAYRERDARHTSWRYADQDAAALAPGGGVAGPLLRHLSEDGRPRASDGADGPPALRARFARASIVSFAVSELVLHALAQLDGEGGGFARGEHGPAGQEHAATLTQVVVTAPASFTGEERAALLACVQAGIDLVWQGFGWAHEADQGGGRVEASNDSAANDGDEPAVPARPQVRLGVDPGLAEQLVYVARQPALAPMHRPTAAPAQHAARAFFTRGAEHTRVMTLHAGYAFTSMSITDALRPGVGATVPVLFAERTGVAANGLIDAVARRLIVPAVVNHLLAHNGDDLSALLDRDEHDIATLDGRLASQVWHKVCRPAATALVGLLPRWPAAQDGVQARRASVGRLIAGAPAPLQPLPACAAQLQTLSGVSGLPASWLADVRVTLDVAWLRGLAHAHYAPVFDAAAGLIIEHRCGTLLLAGGYADLLLEDEGLIGRLPLEPHRIVGVGEGPGGAWAAPMQARVQRVTALHGAALAAATGLDQQLQPPEAGPLALGAPGRRLPLCRSGARGNGSGEARRQERGEARQQECGARAGTSAALHEQSNGAAPAAAAATVAAGERRARSAVDAPPSRFDDVPPSQPSQAIDGPAKPVHADQSAIVPPPRIAGVPR
ncbi:MAG: virulence factor SrfB [Pseudomonadota bacterium]